MTLSKQMREYFVSDNGLPIQVLDDPYFEYYLELLDPYYDSKKKYNLLLHTITYMTKGEDKFHEEVKQFKNSMIHFIGNSPEYQHFIKDMKMPEPFVPLTKGNLYQINNVGKEFISMDLVEANFQALKYVCPKLFIGQENYAEIARRFTDMEYIIGCKKLRQVIFGQLSTARQQSIQRYIMSEIKFYLSDTWQIKPTDFINTSSDEIVFETSRPLGDIELAMGEPENPVFTRILKCGIPQIKGIRIRNRSFKLESKGTTKYTFFTKLYDDGHRDIKQVDSAYIPEVIKFLEGRAYDINPDLDRLFIKDGRLCQFKESLF